MPFSPTKTGGAAEVETRLASSSFGFQSDISPDEKVVFFLTSGKLSSDGKTWIVPVHGVIYEPAIDQRKRGMMVAAIANMLDSPQEVRESRNFLRRLDLFLVDNERGQEIEVLVGGRKFDAGKSTANGHFDATLRLDDSDVRERLADPDAAAPFLDFEAVTRRKDQRRFAGRVQLVRPTGLSIISDIDDTLKISQVNDAEAVLENTFVKNFQPVPGMAKLYQRYASRGVVFHYVSGSPWQLYLPLVEFFEAEGLPLGSFHLKHLRLKEPKTAVKMLKATTDAKRRDITRLLEDYPQRRFVLIGDSGEEDVEIYTEVAETHPRQVVGIFIRNVDGSDISDDRYRQVLPKLERVDFRLFREPSELEPVLDSIERRYGLRGE